MTLQEPLEGKANEFAVAQGAEKHASESLTEHHSVGRWHQQCDNLLCLFAWSHIVQAATSHHKVVFILSWP